MRIRTSQLIALSTIALAFATTACSQDDGDGCDGDDGCGPATGASSTGSGGASASSSSSGGSSVLAEPGTTYTWSFDDDPEGAMPGDFAAILGDWSVQADAGSPSAPNVLRQTSTLSDPEYPRVLGDSPLFQDLALSVRCRPESGSIDQACGLVFRAQDGDNYYITRANVLENNVRLYHVVDGNRQQFATADVTVTAGNWHTLEATASGGDFTVSWDGVEVLSASDATFPGAGMIGLWTKADSVTAFDDLAATAAGR